MVNDDLATAIIPPSGCYSVIGPTERIAFSDAAIFWSSFYHLMFSHNTEAMKRQGLLDHIQKISSLFKIAISYYSISSSKAGYKAAHFTN